MHKKTSNKRFICKTKFAIHLTSQKNKHNSILGKILNTPRGHLAMFTDIFGCQTGEECHCI